MTVQNLSIARNSYTPCFTALTLATLHALQASDGGSSYSLSRQQVAAVIGASD